MKKKILIITPNLSTGGTNSSLSCLYDELKDIYDIDVFAMSHHGHADVSFCNVLLPEHKILSLWNSVFDELDSKRDKLLCTIVKLIKRVAIMCNIGLENVIYSHSLKRLCCIKYNTIISYQEGAATKFVSLSEMSHKVAWVHCDYDNWNPVYRIEEQRIYEEFSQVICVSNYTASVFNKRFNLIHKAIGIHNLQNMQLIQTKARVLLDDIRWDETAYNIISIGRINPVKRFTEIPQIADELIRKGYSFKWYIIGPEFDVAETEKIKNGIKNYHIENNVMLMGAKSNPYPFFAHADLYVCLSESEACPMVFNEAKCLGTPIITTDFGSSYEFIKSDVDGIITTREELPSVIGKCIKNGKTIRRHIYDGNNANVEILEKILNVID